MCTDSFGVFGISEARVHCADAKGAMLLADELAKYLGGVAAWSSAGQLRFVLPAMSTYFDSVAGAARFYTLSICSMFLAQTTRTCFRSAAIVRASFLRAVCTAEATTADVFGAVIYCAFFYCLFLKRVGRGN